MTSAIPQPAMRNPIEISPERAGRCSSASDDVVQQLAIAKYALAVGDVGAADGRGRRRADRLSRTSLSMVDVPASTRRAGTLVRDRAIRAGRAAGQRETDAD